MLENLIKAEKLLRAMLELEPVLRANPEFSELLNHLLDLVANSIDEIQENRDGFY